MPKSRKAEPKFFTIEEMRKLIEHAPEPYRTFYWLAAETGMRAGELCGLRRQDISLEQGVVQVRQSVWRGGTQTPKTEGSRRVFSVSPKLQKHLREFLARETNPEVQFVFHTRSGTPMDPNLIVKRKLKPLCMKLGITSAGLHAFRHGNATYLDQIAAPAMVRQSRLGHSDIRTTLGYTHMIGEDDRRIAAQLGNILHDVERPNLAATV